MDGSGYFFWSYKLGCIPWPVQEWSMLQAVEHGTMPAHVATCDGDECAGHSWECYWDYPRRNTPHSPPPPTPETESGEQAPASSSQAEAPAAEEEAGVAEEENVTSSPDGGEQRGVEGRGDAAVSEASAEAEAAEEAEVEAKPEEGVATEAEAEAVVEAEVEAQASAHAGPQQAEQQGSEEGEQQQPNPGKLKQERRREDTSLVSAGAAMMSVPGEGKLDDAEAATEAAVFVEQATEAEVANSSVTLKEAVWPPPPPPAAAGQAVGTGLTPRVSREGGGPGPAVVGGEREWRPVVNQTTPPLSLSSSSPRQLPSSPASALDSILTAAAAADVLPPALQLWRDGISRPWAHTSNTTVTFARGTSQADANTPW